MGKNTKIWKNYPNLALFQEISEENKKELVFFEMTLYKKLGW